MERFSRRCWVAERANLTEPDEPPVPEEQRRLLRDIPGDASVAFRLVSSLSDGDGEAANAVMAEIFTGPRAMQVTAVLASMVSQLADELARRAGDTADDWLDAVALSMMDRADHLRDMDGRTST